MAAHQPEPRSSEARARPRPIWDRLAEALAKLLSPVEPQPQLVPVRVGAKAGRRR